MISRLPGNVSFFSLFALDIPSLGHDTLVRNPSVPESLKKHTTLVPDTVLLLTTIPYPNNFLLDYPA